MGRGRRQKEIEEEREVSCLSDRRGLQEKREREREDAADTQAYAFMAGGRHTSQEGLMDRAMGGLQKMDRCGSRWVLGSEAARNRWIGPSDIVPGGCSGLVGMGLQSTAD